MIREEIYFSNRIDDFSKGKKNCSNFGGNVRLVNIQDLNQLFQHGLFSPNQIFLTDMQKRKIHFPLSLQGTNMVRSDKKSKFKYYSKD